MISMQLAIQIRHVYVDNASQTSYEVLSYVWGDLTGRDAGQVEEKLAPPFEESPQGHCNTEERWDGRGGR